MSTFRLLIGLSVAACGSSGDSGESGGSGNTELHPLPPAPSDCTLSVGASAITIEDSITVCVPGAYCPSGYGAGETYRDYHASLRHPPEWRLVEAGTLIRSGLTSSAYLRIGPHELRLDEADALARLDDSATGWPDAIREDIELDARPAVHYAYSYDLPQPGTSGPATGSWTAINLDVADGFVVAHVSGNAPTDSDPALFCEIESMLASLTLE